MVPSFGAHIGNLLFIFDWSLNIVYPFLKIITSSSFSSSGLILVGVGSVWKSLVKFVIISSQCFCALYYLAVIVLMSQHPFFQMFYFKDSFYTSQV